MENILSTLGVALLTVIFAIPINANTNGNLEGWVQNELDIDIIVKPFVWTAGARDTNSKGWVLNTSRAPLVVKPGQSAMFDWISGLEATGIAANLFGKTFLRGANVEFAGDKYKPVEIWYEACFRGIGLINPRRVDACATIAGSFIGQNCITGHPDQAFLQDPKNWWMAQGWVKNQVEFVQKDGLLVFARGVIYPITESPDVVFVFRKQ